MKGLDASPLSDALQRHVRTLSRPIHTYHYSNRARLALPPDGGIATDHPAVAPYVTNRVGRFWNLDVPISNFEVIGGLHVALDPVISRVIGGVGDSWVLLEFVLPRGFRFLDVRSAGGETATARLPSHVKHLLAQDGCNTDLPSYLLTTLESKVCRRIAVETLVELDVDGILYDYPRAELPECGQRTVGAFIVLRQQAINLGDVKLLTSVAIDDHSVSDRDRINAAFIEARRGGSVRPVPWPDLVQRMQPPEFYTWANDHLFGCGGHLEDTAVPKPDADPAAYWRERVQQFPTSSWASFYLAEMLRAEKDVASAIPLYELALALDENFVEALRALAAIYAEDSENLNPQRAVTLATRFVELVYYQPRTSAQWPKQRKIEASFALAVADAAAGNWKRAIAYAIQAREASVRERSEAGTPQTQRDVLKATELYDLYQKRQGEKP